MMGTGVLSADKRHPARLWTEFGFNEPAYLVRLQSSPAEIADERLGRLLRRFHLPHPRSRPTRRCTGGDECPYAVSQLEEPFLLKLAIDSRHSVRVDHHRFRERPHARQAIAGTKGAGLTSMPNLLLELEIDRDARSGVWLK